VPLPLQVSSTETGVIFGNIVYEGSGYAERSVVVLNDIHIDIMDYISPAVCADVQFRNMWAEFEWENKVRRARGWWQFEGRNGIVVVSSQPAMLLT
jgi:vesicle coat complex subunit